MNSEFSPPPPPPSQKSPLPIIALVLSLFGCCILPGIASIVLAVVALNNAKHQNQPKPGTAIAAIVISVLSILLGIGLTLAGMKADKEREDAANAMRDRLSKKLTADTLDQDTACDLAKLYFLGVKKEPAEEFRCNGKLEEGEIPRLSDVKRKDGGEDETYTFCFAKAHRWYVVATPADGHCPDEAPAVPGTTPSNEEAWQEQENTLRRKAAEARAKAIIARFEDRVEKLREVIDAAHADGDLKCPSFKTETKASYVDAERILGNVDEEKGWKMMTSREWRDALDESEGAVERAEAIDELQRKGPYVVLFDGDAARDWPIEQGDSYTMGGFDGWMTVVRFDDGEVVCDSQFSFESSESVGGGVKLKALPDKSTRQLIDDDFEDAFEKTATEKIRAMTKGKLKLGLKILE